MSSKLLIGKDLPNLKITLGVDKHEMSTSSSDEEEMIVDEPGNKNDVSTQNDTIVNSLIPEKTVRKYVNKQGSFVTGLDLATEGPEKLQQRAERFGLEEPSGTLTQESINGLYESLGVSSDNSGVRLDTVHLRGVADLSTEEIFQYFVLYGPSTLEWIDDYSCNVVWAEPAGAARALLGISKPVEVKSKASRSKSLPPNDSVPESQMAVEGPALPPSMEEKAEEVILVTDDDDSEDESDAEDARRHKAVSNNTAPPDVNMDQESHHDDDAASHPLLLTTRGRQWRLGEPHPKAPILLMRFAFKDDKKLPGAEKRSLYYKKYGNPNYKGIKGVITSTFRKRLRARKQPPRVQTPPPSPSHSPSHSSSCSCSESSSSEDEDTTIGSISSEESQPTSDGGLKRKKAPLNREEIKRRKMQLYADVEESPRSRLGSREPQEPRASVYSRLGSRPSAPLNKRREEDLRNRTSAPHYKREKDLRSRPSAPHHKREKDLRNRPSAPHHEREEDLHNRPSAPHHKKREEDLRNRISGFSGRDLRDKLNHMRKS